MVYFLKFFWPFLSLSIKVFGKNSFISKIVYWDFSWKCTESTGRISILEMLSLLVHKLTIDLHLSFLWFRPLANCSFQHTDFIVYFVRFNQSILYFLALLWNYFFKILISNGSMLVYSSINDFYMIFLYHDESFKNLSLSYSYLRLEFPQSYLHIFLPFSSQ